MFCSISAPPPPPPPHPPTPFFLLLLWFRLCIYNNKRLHLGYFIKAQVVRAQNGMTVHQRLMECMIYGRGGQLYGPADRWGRELDGWTLAVSVIDSKSLVRVIVFLNKCDSSLDNCRLFWCTQKRPYRRRMPATTSLAAASSADNEPWFGWSLCVFVCRLPAWLH